VSFETAAAALGRFGGVDRRFSHRGEASGVTVIDDYGHHPTEIRATLGAVRKAYAGRRMVVVFQPHRYTRTHALLGDFGRAFNDADRVFVGDVYPAGEAPIAGAEAADVVRAMHEQGHRAADAVGPVEDVTERLAAELLPGDVVVTLGAGSVTRVGPRLLDHLKVHPLVSTADAINDGEEDEAD
jgi:UDP-N-acetylmuramate--alanine ligase